MGIIKTSVNSWVEEALNIIEHATPSKCKILFNSYDSNTIFLTLFKDKNEIKISIFKPEEDEYKLTIRTSIGGNLNLKINEREYITLQLAMLNCLSRFNDNIISFCQNFYNE